MTVPSARPRRSDLVLSVLLPLAVILVGVAASLGPAEAVDGFLAFCRSVVE